MLAKFLLLALSFVLVLDDADLSVLDTVSDLTRLEEEYAERDGWDEYAEEYEGYDEEEEDVDDYNAAEGGEDAYTEPDDGVYAYADAEKAFALIPAGEFIMGSPEGYEKADGDERPRHRVRIGQPFYLSRHELTQGEWVSVMGSNPSRFLGASRPVENVSWEDAQEFIRRLNESGRGGSFRLPTEAEWEYAARAGSDSSYFFGDSPEDLEQYAWYKDNSGRRTLPVGRKAPNAWGLYDMYGNVWEMVQDVYLEDYYNRSPELDPVWPAGESDFPSPDDERVVRGGSWHSDKSFCRSAYRNYDDANVRDNITGFRLVFVPETREDRSGD
ncbi:MAG: formylglycine-generating enzyme family protein [Deltaproteobacteria bacterium]|jgi:formylglycine-generating enzyme required for sulfatase activity|nr:formylglycine-generating enzyme family protein [Deltaproteobacteria bacterium]